MISWLTDTLVYSGALIALVLLLRGPVARQFGPQMSYALWALPLLRFVMPPVVLPASLAPGVDVVATKAGLAELVPLAEVSAQSATAAGLPSASIAASLPDFAPPATPGFWEGVSGMLSEALLITWLGGAAAFLVWRWWTYYRMRDWLLAGARPVGEVGRIRLVESPAVSSPVAFGVSDKVIALPMEFMAMEDRAARDLAIEHELAHHRGCDLLANILAQPILALHWFNPLAWLGWRAMRRDQEAACDARVIARHEPHVRAQYGRVIASFAAGPRLSLAAPMAGHRNFGPLLGEKSIIHRLRSLTMSDVSPRRRIAGRLLLAGAVLALPLTASISYAEAGSLVPKPPAPPAPPEAPLAPVPPVPAVPAIPAVPPVPDVPDVITVQSRQTSDAGKGAVTRSEEKQVFVFTQTSDETPGKVRRFVLQSDKPLTAPQRKALEDMRTKMTSQDWDKYGDQWERQAEQWAKQWEEWGKQVEVGLGGKAGTPGKLAVRLQETGVGCDLGGNSRQVVRASANGGKAQAIVQCRKAAAVGNERARSALMDARNSIARDASLDRETRAEVLESLDREIERLDSEA
ncbi:hypothetical protein SZ64_06540 [Erythrobacter sp. SG61-1L]|uniref:M56 family metallopeptidase n=1 Tax=Erythrobacter sp. SG61-1L TaxID=1603897 RepID=UPI0006C93827|nr:M56 family metallopeptidase [Erythrobacter sp. SG61-1L]KPL67801.1 hypothetical protein SZ64_06540 [Erythrobacter sp. SG61-1L]